MHRMRVWRKALTTNVMRVAQKHAVGDTATRWLNGDYNFPHIFHFLWR
jgi:hypothetical protein